MLLMMEGRLTNRRLSRMDIRELVPRRSDLSTFVVHLTHNDKNAPAKKRLRSILRNRRIEARSMFGQAKSRLEEKKLDFDSQTGLTDGASIPAYGLHERPQ